MRQKMRVLHAWLLLAVALGVCVYSFMLYRRRGVDVMRKSSAQMLGMLASEKRNGIVNYLSLLDESVSQLQSMADSGQTPEAVKACAKLLGFEDAAIGGEDSGRIYDIASCRLSVSRQTALGTLTCFISEQKTRAIFDSANDEERYYSFVADSDGNILTNVGHEGFLYVSDNTIEFYSEAMLYDGVRAQDVLSALKEGRGGNLTYSYGTRGNNVCWTPLGINDWTVFLAATSELTDEGRRDIDKRVLELGVAVSLSMIILSLAFVVRLKKLRDEKKKADADIYEISAIAKQLKDISFTILFECDLKTGKIEYNDSFERQLGRKPEITDFAMLFEDGVDSRLKNMAYEMKRGVPKGKASVQLRHANGAPIWYQIYYVCVYGKDETAPAKVVGRIANIEWHDHEQDAQTAIVEHDALTGLLGHTAFMKRAEKLVKTSRGDCAMMTIDIDDFKIVSQSDNKYSGDELIVRMSDAMRRTFPSGAVMGRISGDVFAVVLSGDISSDSLSQRAAALQKEFEKTGCTCSIGISVSDENASITELCARADKALYRVKLLGKHGYQFFDGGENDTVRDDDTDANALLFKCVASITTIKDFDESMRFVLKQTAKFYDASCASVLLCDDSEACFHESNVYRREKTSESPDLVFSYSQAPNVVKALREHKPLSIFDGDAAGELAQGEIDIIKRRGEKSVYLVPLGDAKAHLGFLGITNPKYHVGNVSFMRTLATCIGCDIEKRRNTK